MKASIQNIKGYIKEKNITYQQLSDLSGIPLNTLKNIFRGKTENPRIDTVQAIERALGIQPQWTDEEIAEGVGNYPISLSDEELAWLDLLNRVKDELGDDYLNAVLSMLRASLSQKAGKK